VTPGLRAAATRRPRAAALGAVAAALWLAACSHALPAIGVATLSWTAVHESVDGQPLADIAGYRIYYGTTRHAMFTVVQLADPRASAYRVTGLSSGTWYFAVVAYTRTGTQGPPSNVVTKTIQ
jgi:hypothetical protein